MNIQEYLSELKSCPKGELTSKLGISDDFPIFLEYDLKKMMHKLEGTPRYMDVSHEYFGQMILKHYTGFAYLKLSPDIPPAYLQGNDFDRCRQSSYSMCINVLGKHDFSSERMDPIDFVKRIVEQISELAIIEKIPLCMPHSLGYTRDVSRIVYNDPFILN